MSSGNLIEADIIGGGKTRGGMKKKGGEEKKRSIIYLGWNHSISSPVLSNYQIALLFFFFYLSPKIIQQ